MKRYVNFLGLIVLLLCCKKDEAQPLNFLPTNASSTQTACFESRPVVRQVKEIIGIVSQSQGQELYSINYSVPGTYDSIWVGFTCNLPDEYKVVGKQVIFSGEYRKGPAGIVTIGGEETYYLFLNSIRAR